jgi:hypothetical protein
MDSFGISDPHIDQSYLMKLRGNGPSDAWGPGPLSGEEVRVYSTGSNHTLF